MEGPALQSPTLKLALLQSYQLISVCVCVCVCARERDSVVFFFFSFLDFISHIFKICSVAVLPVHFCVYMYMSVHVRVCGCLFCTPNVLESHPLIAAHFFSDKFCSLYHQKIKKTKSFHIFSYFPCRSFLTAKKASDKMTVMIGIMSDYVVVLSSRHLNCCLVVVLSSCHLNCRLVVVLSSCHLNSRLVIWTVVLSSGLSSCHLNCRLVIWTVVLLSSCHLNCRLVIWTVVLSSELSSCSVI